jgi:hypothetical protein
MRICIYVIALQDSCLANTRYIIHVSTKTIKKTHLHLYSVFQMSIPCTGKEKGVASLLLGLRIFNNSSGLALDGTPISFTLKKHCEAFGKNLFTVLRYCRGISGVFHQGYFIRGISGVFQEPVPQNTLSTARRGVVT